MNSCSSKYTIITLHNMIKETKIIISSTQINKSNLWINIKCKVIWNWFQQLMNNKIKNNNRIKTSNIKIWTAFIIPNHTNKIFTIKAINKLIRIQIFINKICKNDQLTSMQFRSISFIKCSLLNSTMDIKIIK